MTDLKLLCRSDYPSLSREVDVNTNTRINELRIAISRAFGWEAEQVGKYHLLAVEWLHDALDLAKHPETATLGTVGVANRSTLLLQAPTELKPPVQKRKKAGETVEEEGKGADRYKGFNVKNAINKLLTLKGKQKKVAFEYFDIYASKIVASQGFKSLPAKVLLEIVKRDTLACKEVELFSGVLDWGKRELKDQKAEETPDEMKRVLADVLPFIRFPIMTTQDMALKVSPSKLLDSQQTLNLFTYLGTKGQKLHPCLAKFSTKPRKGRKPPAWFKFDAGMKHSQLTVDSEGYLLSSTSTSYYQGIFGNVELKSGQHEWEFELSNIYSHSFSIHLGVSPSSFSNYNQSGMIGYSGHIPGWAMSCYGSLKYVNGQQSSYGKQLTNGDHVRVLLDMDKRTLSFAVNSEEPTLAFEGIEGPVRPAVSLYGTNTVRLIFPS